MTVFTFKYIWLVYIFDSYLYKYMEFGISLVPDSDQKDLSHTGNKIILNFMEV